MAEWLQAHKPHWQVVIFKPCMRQSPILLHDTRELPKVDGPDDLKGFKLAFQSIRSNGKLLAIFKPNGVTLMAP